jgi:hypothetical protein
MPLLKPDDASRDPNYVNAFAQKADMDPPSPKHLYLVAVTLGMLRVVIERIFRATSNPFAFILQCEIIGEKHCSDEVQEWVIGLQCLGLFVAGLYAYFYLPPPKVMSKIYGNGKTE